jgi:hypothetical protein
MATVTAAITLTSSDLVTDSLSLSDTTSVTITGMSTSGLSRRKVAGTTQGASITLYDADSYDTNPAYLYIKNTDETPSDYLYVWANTGNDPDILKLAGGDWAFLPLKGDRAMKVYATTPNTVVEWIVFGNAA